MTVALLHYEVHSDGDAPARPYALLVHGMLSSRAQWLPNLAALSEVARPVVVELLGHGRSPSPSDPALYTPQHYTQEFERIRAALHAERWYVIGQSLGASLVLRYALDFPERLLALVITNSNSAFMEAGFRERAGPAMARQAEALRRDGRAALAEHRLNPSAVRHVAPEVKAALTADFALHDPEGVALTGLHTTPISSVREEVAGLAVPTLLVVGEREERFQAARRYAEATVPGLEVVGLPAGHAVNLQAVEGFNRAVVAFLRRHAP